MVPGRVAAGLKGVADAAVGEARRVGFLLHEEFSRKLFYHTSLAVMLDKSVMLFGCGLGQRLEPVGVVARTVVDGPAFHAFGHAVGHFARDGLLVVDGVAERFVGVDGEILKHLGAVEHLGCIVLLRTLLGDVHCHRLTVGSLFNYFESKT